MVERTEFLSNRPVESQGLSAIDDVSAALRSLDVRSSIFCLTDLRAPWGVRLERDGGAKFHVVFAGSCSISVQGRRSIGLQKGDLVLVPRGDAHAVCDKDGSPIVALDELIAAQHRRNSTEEIQARLLCGGFALNDRLSASIESLLPDVIRVDAATVAGTTWLQPVLAALEAEIANGLPGAHAIQAKMADVLLAQVLRSWLAGADRAGLRIDGVLADPPTARALEALRDRYAEHWTIDRLASHVALSRSALAARFREHVGDSPMHYLTRIRVGQAAGYLATTRLSLSEIAHLTGYGSDAALSKAFRREVGQTPGAYRADSSHPPAITLTAA